MNDCSRYENASGKIGRLTFILLLPFWLRILDSIYCKYKLYGINPHTNGVIELFTTE